MALMYPQLCFCMGFSCTLINCEAMAVMLGLAACQEFLDMVFWTVVPSCKCCSDTQQGTLQALHWASDTCKQSSIGARQEQQSILTWFSCSHCFATPALLHNCSQAACHLFGLAGTCAFKMAQQLQGKPAAAQHTGTGRANRACAATNTATSGQRNCSWCCCCKEQRLHLSQLNLSSHAAHPPASWRRLVPCAVPVGVNAVLCIASASVIVLKDPEVCAHQVWVR